MTQNAWHVFCRTHPDLPNKTEKYGQLKEKDKVPYRVAYKSGSIYVVNVKNVSGSSKNNQVDNLKEKYEQAGGSRSSICQVKGCGREREATAHVRLAELPQTSPIYFTPLCAPHNSSKNRSEMTVPLKTLVSNEKIQS